MKSKRKIEMFDEKSKRACLPSVEDESALLAVGFDMPGNHSDDETDDGEYQDLSMWGQSQDDGVDELYVCSEEEDTEEEKRVGGGRRVRRSELCDPRGSHGDEPRGLGDGARGLSHSGAHELDGELSVGSEEEDEAHRLSEGGARWVGVDLQDDELLDDGVRGVSHGTSTGGLHGLGHGSHGLGSELSVGREEEGDQHSEGCARGLGVNLHDDKPCGLEDTHGQLDDGVCGLGGDMHRDSSQSPEEIAYAQRPKRRGLQAVYYSKGKSV